MPELDVPEGLLSDWWSIFWDRFSPSTGDLERPDVSIPERLMNIEYVFVHRANTSGRFYCFSFKHIYRHLLPKPYFSVEPGVCTGGKIIGGRRSFQPRGANATKSCNSCQLKSVKQCCIQPYNAARSCC
jgi:hypothetical protein